MNRNTLSRLDKLDKPQSMMHKTIHYCATVTGKQKIFASKQEAIEYQKHHPGWYAETKFLFPNGHEIVWNNAKLYRQQHPERVRQ